MVKPESEMMEVKYVGSTGASREPGPENINHDHRAGTWRHDRMSAFPPDLALVPE